MENRGGYNQVLDRQLQWRPPDEDFSVKEVRLFCSCEAWMLTEKSILLWVYLFKNYYFIICHFIEFSDFAIITGLIVVGVTFDWSDLLLPAFHIFFILKKYFRIFFIKWGILLRSNPLSGMMLELNI